MYFPRNLTRDSEYFLNDVPIIVRCNCKNFLNSFTDDCKWKKYLGLGKWFFFSLQKVRISAQLIVHLKKCATFWEAFWCEFNLSDGENFKFLSLKYYIIVLIQCGWKKTEKKKKKNCNCHWIFYCLFITNLSLFIFYFF